MNTVKAYVIKQYMSLNFNAMITLLLCSLGLIFQFVHVQKSQQADQNQQHSKINAWALMMLSQLLETC